MKDTIVKKRWLPPAFSIFQQLEIHHRNLLQQFLRLSKRTLTFPDLFLEFFGDGDLAHAPASETDREYPDWSVTAPLAFLAIPTTGLITVHHSTQQGTWQDRGKIRHLLDESFAGGSQRDLLIFHLQLMKDIIIQVTTQQKY